MEDDEFTVAFLDGKDVLKELTAKIMQSISWDLCIILMQSYKTDMLTLPDAVFGRWVMRIAKYVTVLFTMWESIEIDWLVGRS